MAMCRNLRAGDQRDASSYSTWVLKSVKVFNFSGGVRSTIRPCTIRLRCDMECSEE